MISAVARRSRICAAHSTVDRIISRSVSSTAARCSPCRRCNPWNHYQHGYARTAAFDHRRRRSSAYDRIGDSGSRRELSCFSRTEQSQASTVSGAATTLDSRRSSSADVANGGDDSGAAVCVSSTTTDENKQQAVKSSARRRKRAAKKGSDGDVADSAEAAAVRAREVLEAYKLAESGSDLPPLGAFGNVSDEVDFGDCESEQAPGGPGAGPGEEEATEPKKEKGRGQRGGRAQKRAEKMVAGGQEDLELSTLLVGLHRRVLWRVYKKKARSTHELAEPGKEALAYYRRIQELGSFPPRFLCSLLVQLLVSEHMNDEAEAVFQDIIDRGMEPTEACATEIIRLRVQNDRVDGAMEILMMLEGNELSNDNSKLRFRSYQPVIRGLIRKGDMEGVMKLWKHMQWHNVLPKESFVVDLIADLTSNPDSAASEGAEMLADNMLDGVSRQIMYPSAPTVSALIEGFGAVLTDVSDEGDCTTCGSRLQKNDLGPMDRMQMRSAIMRVAALRSARQVQTLSWFASWLSSLNEMPTAVIDGPNVGYTGQNHGKGGFHLEQVDWLAEHMHSLGERVLIIMPKFYCMPAASHRRPEGVPTRPSKLTKTDEALLQKWLAKKWLVITEGHDDLYWMYSTVAHDSVSTVVLTNDAMRDHRNFMPSERHFMRWKQGHMVRFSFNAHSWLAKWEADRAAIEQGSQPGDAEKYANLKPPGITLTSGLGWGEVQRSGDHWHLPVRMSDTGESKKKVRKQDASDQAHTKAGCGEEGKKWLCVPVPKSRKSLVESISEHPSADSASESFSVGSEAEDEELYTDSVSENVSIDSEAEPFPTDSDHVSEHENLPNDSVSGKSSVDSEAESYSVFSGTEIPLEDFISHKISYTLCVEPDEDEDSPISLLNTEHTLRSIDDNMVDAAEPNGIEQELQSSIDLEQALQSSNDMEQALQPSIEIEQILQSSIEIEQELESLMDMEKALQASIDDTLASFGKPGSSSTAAAIETHDEGNSVPSNPTLAANETPPANDISSPPAADTVPDAHNTLPDAADALLDTSLTPPPGQTSGFSILPGGRGSAGGRSGRAVLF